jgi:hypothetical protein
MSGSESSSFHLRDQCGWWRWRCRGEHGGLGVGRTQGAGGEGRGAEGWATGRDANTFHPLDPPLDDVGKRDVAPTGCGEERMRARGVGEVGVGGCEIITYHQWQGEWRDEGLGGCRETVRCCRSAAAPLDASCGWEARLPKCLVLRRRAVRQVFRRGKGCAVSMAMHDDRLLMYGGGHALRWEHPDARVRRGRLAVAGSVG